jgi:hypothetical protein
MADKRRPYSVTLAGDDPTLLQMALSEIAEEGGRVNQCYLATQPHRYQ